MNPAPGIQNRYRTQITSLLAKQNDRIQKLDATLARIKGLNTAEREARISEIGSIISANAGVLQSAAIGLGENPSRIET